MRNIILNCIYCGNNITTSTKEHIIQSALGSNLHSFSILCSDCNNYFARSESGKIDDVISEQFKIFRNFFIIWGDRNTPPPVLKNVRTKTGRIMNLAPGGVPLASYLSARITL